MMMEAGGGARSRLISRYSLTTLLGAIVCVPIFAAAVPTVDAFLDSFSVVQGGELKVFVSSDAPTLDLHVFRIGNPDQEVLTQRAVPAAGYAVPTNGWTVGADWPKFSVVPVSADWVSGLYQIEFVAGGQSLRTLNFVVREDQPGSQANILVLDNAPTQIAYNNWGGKSLYTFNSTDKIAAVAVSLRRPGNQTGIPQESEFLHWANAMGVPVEYASMFDLHSDPQLLSHYKVVVLVGHSEYWTREMRDCLEAFLAGGGNAAILGGDTMWWQVRIENDQLVGYKETASNDPLKGIDDTRVTTNWYAAPVLRPENAVTVVSWRHGGYVNASGFYLASDGWGGYTVTAADHWLFSATGLHNGDVFGQEQTIAGYETDGAVFSWINGNPVVTGAGGTPQNYQILAYTPAKTNAVSNGNATMGLYQTAGDGYVFNAATVDWADGLWSIRDSKISNTQVSTITYNAFSSFAVLAPLIPETPLQILVPSEATSESLVIVWSGAIAKAPVWYELERAS